MSSEHGLGRTGPSGCGGRMALYGLTLCVDGQLKL